MVMKKIICVVLVVTAVLAMCTTAMAAPSPYLGPRVIGYDANGNTVDVKVKEVSTEARTQALANVFDSAKPSFNAQTQQLKQYVFGIDVPAGTASGALTLTIYNEELALGMLATLLHNGKLIDVEIGNGWFKFTVDSWSDDDVLVLNYVLNLKSPQTSVDYSGLIALLAVSLILLSGMSVYTVRMIKER